jgi:2-polyprenyl-6-methoxyphenol hydroxylase-like FAD-dependent oxidoreductase
MLDPLKDQIQWGKKMQLAETNPDGSHVLHFADGSSVSADLVVGADGAWSKVRRLVTDQVPTYSGVTSVAFEVDNVDEKQSVSKKAQKV